MTDTNSIQNRLGLIVLALVFVVGIFLRLPPSLFSGGENPPLRALAFLHPQPKWHEMGLIGVDENLYRNYINEVSEKGLTAYPDIVLHYIEKQLKLPGSVLPPVRFFYIFAGYIWHSVFPGETLDALRNVASFFGMLTLGLSCLFAWRMGGRALAIPLTALMAVAPTQIHMSQHALVDGIFTFWALLTLWLLWENLRAPRDWRWLLAYTLSFAVLTLTKENSAFVWIAAVAVLLTNRWLKFGTVPRELVLATIMGPLLGVIVLIFLAGGIDILYGTYRLLINKNLALEYAQKTGDGPWYRYLVDLMLVSPLVLIFAFAGLFHLRQAKKPEWFAVVFIGASYLVMANLKYGMNLRYANMWDMPLRLLAVSGLIALLARLTKHRGVVFAVLVTGLCLVELRQYVVLATAYPLYELIPELFLRALHILK